MLCVTAIRRIVCVIVAMLVMAPLAAEGFAFSAAGQLRRGAPRVTGVSMARPMLGLRMQVQDEEKSKVRDAEEVTKKYGLEAGLFTAIT